LSSCQKDKNQNNSSKIEPINTPKLAAAIQIGPNLLKSLESKLESSYSHSKDTLIARLGEPLNLSVDTIGNPYYDMPDSLFTLNYNGLVVKLNYVTGDGRTLLTRVVMTNSSRLIEFGFPEGTRRDSFELQLHKKTYAIFDRSSDEVTLEYKIDDEDAPSYLQFTFIKNRLNKIEYFPYFD
jgi:hypothetical protein